MKNKQERDSINDSVIKMILVISEAISTAVQVEKLEDENKENGPGTQWEVDQPRESV